MPAQSHHPVTDHEIADHFAAIEAPPRRLRQLLLGLAMAAAALAIRAVLDPWLGEQHPYVVAFAAVAFATRLGSWRAGLLCAALSFAGSDYLFVSPRLQLGPAPAEIAGGLGFFALAALILSQGHRAGAATRQLRSLVQRLSESDARKSDFLAMLAHEIRNPISAARNALQILRLPVDEPTRTRALDVLDRQLAQLGSLTDDLMDASQIQSGKLVLQPVDMPLADLLAQSVDSVRASTEARRQQVDVQAAGDLHVRADRVRLVQVFSNLLHNASKFSPPGSTIVVQARREGAQVCIRVSDPGIGIAPEKLEWVFDTYAQIRAGGGLGLGLSLVRRLVELHGGRVLADSRGLGRGTTFSVWLPADGGPAPAR